MKTFIKFHGEGESAILAVCDECLIGQILKDDVFYIEIKEGFFKGKLVDDSDLCKLIESCSNMNLVGNHCVDVAEKSGFIDRSLIQKVNGISFCTIFSL